MARLRRFRWVPAVLGVILDALSVAGFAIDAKQFGLLAAISVTVGTLALALVIWDYQSQLHDIQRDPDRIAKEAARLSDNIRLFLVTVRRFSDTRDERGVPIEITYQMTAAEQASVANRFQKDFGGQVADLYKRLAPLVYRPDGWIYSRPQRIKDIDSVMRRLYMVSYGLQQGEISTLVTTDP